MTYKRPTIEDVARLAGLSTATVSRFINGTATVSEERAVGIRTLARKQPSWPGNFPGCKEADMLSRWRMAQ